MMTTTGKKFLELIGRVKEECLKGKEIRRREQGYTEARYVVPIAAAVLSDEFTGDWRQGRVALQYGGQCDPAGSDRPTSSQAKSLRGLEVKFKIQ